MGVLRKDMMFRRGLIVSCQALEDEPLFGSGIMPKMALAAKSGGAVGLRANGVDDISNIKKVCHLPVIGIIKANYPGYEVYITPTMQEVERLIEAEPDIIAIDATARPRPEFEKPEQFISAIKSRCDIPIMADISNYEEGVAAYNSGADVISTTLSSYTPYTADRAKPDLELIKMLVNKLDIPVIAEGNIQTPNQALACLEAGAYAVVVGGAITRPQLITQRFVETISKALT